MLVIQRPYWEKAIIVVSAIPIAIICNATRVTIAAVLQDRVGPSAEEVFHDWVAPSS